MTDIDLLTARLDAFERNITAKLDELLRLTPFPADEDFATAVDGFLADVFETETKPGADERHAA